MYHANSAYGDIAMAQEIDSKEEEFERHFSDNLTYYQSAEKRIRNLIQALLLSDGVDISKIVSRIKDKDGCLKKYRDKYKYNKHFEERQVVETITELIGIRVVCFYEDDIEFVRETIQKSFTTKDITDKSKQIDSTSNLFGYKGIDLDLCFNEDRKRLHEYKDICDLNFELQIRSLSQDTWSEVDHRLKYKKDIPLKLQRRTIRLSALFELIDQEFIAIRNETHQLEEAAREQIKNPTKIELVELNSIVMREFLQIKFPKYTFDVTDVDNFINDIKSIDTITSFKYLVDSYQNNEKIISKYRKFRSDTDFVRINPYTFFRHVIYASDKQKFKDILYEKQAASFDAWHKNNGK